MERVEMALAESAASKNRLLGIGLMVLAMLTIPGVDGFAKALSTAHSPMFVSWARYVAASLIVLPIAAIQYGGGMLPSQRRVPHFVRTLLMVTSMTLYFLALSYLPMATAMGTFFIGPIVAVVLSIFVLGERMTVRKGMSLALGFAGALVIVQPGTEINPGTLLALGAGLSYGVYLVATRLASQSSSPLRTLAFQCVVGTALLTPQAIYTWSTPAIGELWMFAALGIFSVVSHGLSIAAFRFADASTLSPLVYLEMLGTVVVGYIVFSEVPGIATVVGASAIIAAGLVLVERRRPIVQSVDALP